MKNGDEVRVTFTTVEAPDPSACLLIMPLDEGGEGIDTTPYWTNVAGTKRWRYPDGEPME